MRNLLQKSEKMKQDICDENYFEKRNFKGNEFIFDKDEI